MTQFRALILIQSVVRVDLSGFLFFIHAFKSLPILDLFLSVSLPFVATKRRYVKMPALKLFTLLLFDLSKRGDFIHLLCDVVNGQ